jgi:hypothetical protein
MATYYITAIKKETVGNHTFIAHIVIHLVDNAGVHTGVVRSKNDIIALIKARNQVYSAIWNYTNISWSQQELVGIEVRQGQEYLKTTPDNSQRDNLLHLLPLVNLGL